MSNIRVQSRIETNGAKLLQNLQLLQQQGQLCDVVLVAAVDGQRFPCHRNVLAACSAYFKAMFTNNCGALQLREVPLTKVRGDQLQPLLNFCYTGEFEANDVGSVQELLGTAALLLFNDVRDVCADFLEAQISAEFCEDQQDSPSNYLETYALADKYELNGLKSAASKYIGREFVNLWQTDEFLQLSVSALVSLLATNDVDVPSEELVFESAMSWMLYAPAERFQHTPKLLGAVRLCLLPARMLIETVQPICLEYGCMHLLAFALYGEDEPEAQLEVSEEQTTPADCGRADLVAVYQNEDWNINIELYCRTTDAWTTFAHYDLKRFNFAAAILNDKLIIVGGLESTNELSSVSCFDLEAKTSTQLAVMPTARSSLAVAVLDGQLYAVGGCKENTVVNTVERYDPVANAWSSVEPMTVARSSFAVAELHGCLYAVGGRKRYSRIAGCRTTECYDPLTNEWTLRADMRFERLEHELAAKDGLLYAVGGYLGKSLMTLERYDPGTNAWSQLCTLNIRSGPLACAFLGASLLACSEATGDVEQYHVGTNTWSSWMKMPQITRGLKLFATPNLD